MLKVGNATRLGKATRGNRARSEQGSSQIWSGKNRNSRHRAAAGHGCPQQPTQGTEGAAGHTGCSHSNAAQNAGPNLLLSCTKHLAGCTVQCCTQPRGCSRLQHLQEILPIPLAQSLPGVQHVPHGQLRPHAATLQQDERGRGWWEPCDLSQQPQNQAQQPHPCGSHGQASRNLGKALSCWQPAPSGSLNAIKLEWVFPPPAPPSSSSPPPFGDIAFRQNKQGSFAWAHAGGWHLGPMQQQVEMAKALQRRMCNKMDHNEAHTSAHSFYKRGKDSCLSLK